MGRELFLVAGGSFGLNVEALTVERVLNWGGYGTAPVSRRRRRAITLDYVIDVLADWAQCDVPEWREQVRHRKETEHHGYYDWYRGRWG